MKRITAIAILSLLIMAAPYKNTQAQIQNPRGVEYQWETDTTRASVDLSEIQLVLPRQSFPTLDYPDFIGKEKGLDKFFNHEPVISVAIDGKAKAYPLNMLTMHEISNDTLSGVPILPTYCPLCNSSMVFDRRVNHDGKEYRLEYEVSGLLRNSNLIIADKQTESWWQQLTGTGIVGKLSGVELNVIPSMIVSVEEFFNSYPEGRILSPETGSGAEEKYGTNPYVNYDEKSNEPYARYFNHDSIDSRLPAMERLIDVKGSDGYKIYPFSKIAEKGVINDTYDGQNLVIFYKGETVSILDEKNIEESRAIGSATVFYSVIEGKSLTFVRKDNHFMDKETGSLWDITGKCIQGDFKGKSLEPLPHSNHFAFSWLAFHPESEIYGH